MKAYALAVLLLAGSAPAISDDLEDAFQNLKDAEAKGDAALVKKFAVETCSLIRKQASQPAPEAQAEKDVWTQTLRYLNDIETRTEYALYTTALKSPPAVTVDLITTLEEVDPKSKYLDAAYTNYFVALSQTGAGAKVPAIAEKALKNFPENEDLLLILADQALNRKQTDRALNYAERATTVLSKHGKPEGMAAADWERKRNLALGRSRWIAGMCHAEKAQYGEADKDLRAALPLIQGNDALLGPALFHLGVANYQIAATIYDKARMLEAAKFSDQAAAYKGPLAQQAWRNALAMRQEAQKLR